jgi:hypothetical protein
MRQPKFQNAHKWGSLSERLGRDGETVLYVLKTVTVRARLAVQGPSCLIANDTHSWPTLGQSPRDSHL